MLRDIESGTIRASATIISILATESVMPEVNQEKREKFRELAESRTNRAIEAISRIGNLSNRNLYVYDESDVKKIIKALRATVGEVEGRFASPGKKPSGTFKL